MREVNEAPSNVLGSLKMLAAFSGSVVALTIEKSRSVEFIHAEPEGDKADGLKSVLGEVLRKITVAVKDKRGWVEIRDPQLVSPFRSVRVYNLSTRSMAHNQLCLLSCAQGEWSHNHGVLLDQTRQMVERQLEYAISENGSEEISLLPDDSISSEVIPPLSWGRGFHVAFNKGLTNDWDNSLQLLLDYAPVGVFFYSTSLCVTAVNKHFISFFGATEKKLLNFNLANVRDKSILPAIKTPLSGKEGSYEGTYTSTISGNMVNIILKTAPIRNNSGEITGVMGIVQDNTEQLKTLRALQESEECFRVVATQANDIIFEWNPLSDKMKWFGKTGYIGDAEVPPRTFSEFIALIHTDDQERVAHFWEKRFPLKEEWHDEFRVELKNRAMKHYRASGIMIFKDGMPGKALGTFTDITQEKELISNLKDAAEEAQRNQARITGLLSVIPDLMFVFDRYGVFKDYHADSEQSLYITPEHFIDRVVDDVLPPDVAALTHEKINLVRRHKGIETYEYELSLNNEYEVYESRMVFVEDDKILTIVRDVTRARKVENELIEAKEQAEKSDRLKSAFLANMSHEIRTPMNGILGFSELLRNADMAEQEKENCIDVIVKSGQQLLSIINDVLEVSQLETGQVLVFSERVNLNRLIKDLANFFRIEGVEKSIELSFQIPENEVYCTLDGGKVTQIFNNLLSNALKFTSPGGHIVFGFEDEDKRIRFFVHDDGVGIAPRNHDIIFERFGQVLKIGARNKGGTGLGLSICKSLAELMGGEIWVESAAGQGSSFFFTIPKG